VVLVDVLYPVHSHHFLLFLDFEVPPEQQILATLFYLGQEKASIEDLCDKFHISFETFSQILNRVTSAVCNLSDTIICLPHSVQRKENTKAFFARNNGLQGAIGKVYHQLAKCCFFIIV